MNQYSIVPLAQDKFNEAVGLVLKANLDSDASRPNAWHWGRIA